MEATGPDRGAAGSGRVLWSPGSERVNASEWVGFARRVGVEPDALQAWSVANPGEFWAAVWDFFGVEGSRGERLIEGPAPGGDPRQVIPQTRFLPDATLNVAGNLLRMRGSDPAVIVHAEDGERQVIGWDELRLAVGQAQEALRRDGVAPGDCVALWLPVGLEAVVATLAATALGAIVTSTSPDFGAAGVLDRFEQVAPVVLVAARSYPYNGKVHDLGERIGVVAERLTSLRRTVLVGAAGAAGAVGAARAAGYADALDGCTSWHDWLEGIEPREPEFPAFAFDHPWYVLYSSGTTGKPKSIVHRAGGLLLKHLTEHRLHCDVKPGDRVFYFTTLGWMMWNWVLSGLAAGATVVLYDGNPMYPDPMRLWRLAEQEKVTLFGTSAKYLDACAKAGLNPGGELDLSALRTITSTGSPLVPERFAYVYEAISADVHLASISGGTDLCGCLVLGSPVLPVRAGEIQAPALGLDIDITDESGARLPVGERGELICRNAFPSTPLKFWGDADGSRYRAAYFDRIPGVWHHGDFALRTPAGGFVVVGRSDTTLNPGGVRIGTAEIYRQVEQIPEVVESLVFGQDWDDDVRIVLAVRLAPGAAPGADPGSAPGATLDDALLAAIKARIRNGCSPRHVPAVVIAVEDLPRTRSGKLVELAAGDAVSGRQVRNTEAIANVEALWALRDHPALKK